MRWQLLPLLLALALLCGCIGPKNKTILLAEPSAEVQAQPQSTVNGFEIKRICRFPMDKLDPSGLHASLSTAVVGWLDNDNLLALGVLADAFGKAEGELASVSYQYGFYNALERISGQVPECLSLSPTHDAISYQLENESVGKFTLVQSLADGSTLLRNDSFRTYSPPVWSDDGQTLAVAAVVGGKYSVFLLQMDTGAVTNLNKEYDEALVVMDFHLSDSLLVRRDLGDDSYLLEMINTSTRSAYSLYTGRLTKATALSGTTALALSRDSLRFLSTEASEGGLLESNVLAYALSNDRANLALATTNMDGSVDIAVGQWTGRQIINKKVVYKNIGFSVDRLTFSPDSFKLFVGGQAMDGSGQATGLILEFA